MKKATQLKICAAVTGVLLLNACSPATAESGKAAIDGKPAVSAGTDADTLKKVWEERWKEQPIKILSVTPTPLNGIFEVAVDSGARKEIIYSDVKGNYIVDGILMNVQTKQNLTEGRLEELNKINFGALSFNLAVKEVKGDGSRKVVVFSDPDCPFCRSFERDILANTTNVTVYNFILPIESLHPEAARKARNIVCSENPAKAWSDWMNKGIETPKAANGCKPAIDLDSVRRMADDMGVVGTPTLFFADGTRLGGRPRDVQMFEDLLNKHGR